MRNECDIHSLTQTRTLKGGRFGLTPTYKDMKKFPSTNNVEYSFGFAMMSLSILWVATEMNIFCLAYSTQHMTVVDGINTSRKKVLALKYVMFQL